MANLNVLRHLFFSLVTKIFPAKSVHHLLYNRSYKRWQYATKRCYIGADFLSTIFCLHKAL